MRKLTLALAALAATLAGQARTEGLEREPVIGGLPMSCRDFRGLPVLTTRSTKLGDVGRAWVIMRTPIIMLDPDRLATLPDKMQVFFYGHECAHHVLGHNFNPTMSAEKEADCWSIKNGRDNKLFTREDVVGFAPYLAHSRGSPFGHLPGPERGAFLVECFDDSSRPHAASH